MLFLIFSLISALFAFNYQPGDVFSYIYTSHVNTGATTDPTKKPESYFDFTCNATFTVMSLDADGAFLSLVVSNISGKVEGMGGKDDLLQYDEVDQYFANPLYFKLLPDGSIIDVVGSREDDTEVINVKTGIAFSLRTHLDEQPSDEYWTNKVVDVMGNHNEYSTITVSGASRTINTFFSEADFSAFVDRNLDSSDISLDVKTQQVLTDGRVNQASSTSTVVLTKKATLNTVSRDDSEFQIVVSGEYNLEHYTVMPSVKIGAADGINTVPQFLSYHRKYAFIPQFRASYYSAFKPAAPVSRTPIAEATCPGSINFCKSVDKTWSAGNQNVGVSLHTWALAGVTLGCGAEHRSYMAGAYATLDVVVLQKTLNVVDAFIEYGQVDGVAQRNALSVSLFGTSVYYKALPYLDCIQKTWTLGKYANTFKFPYSTQVYIVTLSFYVSVGVSLSAEVTTKICPMEFNANAVLVPRASLTLGGGAEASVKIFKIGVEFSGSTGDSLDPTVYVDGGLCRVGFKASNTFDGITAQLTGYYSIIGSKTNFNRRKIVYDKSHDFVIWSHRWEGRTDTLIDVHWDAK